MSLWEYKILTSGALGFGSAALLEQHLNQLGKDQWEIISWQTAPSNPLIFQGLARRPVLRDWFPETSEMTHAPRTEERHEHTRDDVDDEEPEERKAPVEEVEEEEGDDLPSLFDALRPFLRRNKHGPGWSVELSFLARKFEQDEGELLNAFAECGVSIPENADEKPDFVESDGSLYWLNRNQRGQVWVNAKEIPKNPPPSKRQERAPEKPVQRDPQPEIVNPALDRPTERPAAFQTQTIPLVGDGKILDQLRGLMRRNRRGHGYSGNIAFLARALNQEPNQLIDTLADTGIPVPADASDRTPGVEWDGNVYWFNKNQSGQLWLNGRPKRGESASDSVTSGDASEPMDRDTDRLELPREPQVPASVDSSAQEQTPSISAELSRGTPTTIHLAALRPFLKKKKSGSGSAAKVSELADALGRAEAEIITGLSDIGLELPANAKAKPTFAEYGEEVFWLNKNPKGEIWLNAKEQLKKKPSKPRGKRKGD